MYMISPSGPKTVSDIDDFTIKTVLTNTGDETLTLLNDPNSILTPKWKTNIFGITSTDGKSANFNGVIVKWKPELAIADKDFTILKAGQSIELEQNLSGVYNLTSSGAGCMCRILFYPCYCTPLMLVLTSSLQNRLRVYFLLPDAHRQCRDHRR